MKLTIERIPIDSLSYEDFVRRFYEPEIPVILTDAGVASPGVLTPDYLHSTFRVKSREKVGWYDAEMPTDPQAGPIRIPSLVSSTLGRNDVVHRSTPMRVWLQPGGHKTLLHYDKNSLHGFNAQVHGRKSWILVSPATPLPTVPFNFVALVKEGFIPDSARYDVMEFKTHPGDMLFLPRYWYHGVATECDVNNNINWVFSPDSPNLRSEFGRRECEMLKLRQMMPLLFRWFPGSLNGYAGDGKRVVPRYVAGIGPLKAMIRLLKECLRLPRLLWLSKDIRRQAKTFARNNFNVVPKAT